MSPEPAPPESPVARVPVRHAGGAYEVVVGQGLLPTLGARVARLLPGRRLAAIVDDALSPHLAGWLGGAAPWDLLATVPPGEESKSRVQWARLTDVLLDHGFGRDSAIVAIGGGVTGDLAGFVAATFLRGLPYVQVPTTTVAMLDSAVGGKTGVDTRHGKNLVGAFHPPALVLADLAALATLHERHFAAGLAEAVKHGLIRDAAYFAGMERDAAALRARDGAVLAGVVARSVELKAAVVQADEFEQGERATLNAGHTVAHAIEHVTGYALLHGECVALGLVAECAIAERVTGLPADVRPRVAALLAALGLPVRLPYGVREPELLAAMRSDKKNRAGAVRCALPAALGTMAAGDGRYTHAVTDEQLLAGLAAIR